MKTQSPIITALLAHITAECNAVDREAAYCDFLNESGPVEVAGLTFSPATIIKSLDETAFRCGVNDYADSLDWTEIDGDYYEDRDIDAAKESFADTKRDEITEKETELADINEEASKEDAGDWSEEITKAEAELASLQAELTEIEGYAF